MEISKYIIVSQAIEKAYLKDLWFFEKNPIRYFLLGKFRFETTSFINKLYKP